MRITFAILCFAFAVAAFLCGFITAWRQSRPTEQNAITPTLPFAVQAAIFIVLGLVWLPYQIPWWGYVIAFLGSVLGLGWLIHKASGDP